jgi:PqqD family protein of HPr-rel-A system
MSSHRVLQDLALSETGFVFDPRTGATFTVNPTGLAVLGALRDGLSIDDIVARLDDRFGGAPNAGDARDQVADFIHVLRQQGLLP